MKELLTLNKYFRKYWFKISAGVTCVILSNYFAIFVPVFVRQGFDDAYFNVVLFGSSQSWNLVKIILVNSIAFGMAILLASLIKGVFMYLMRQTLVITSREIEFDQKNELFQKYSNLDETFYRKNFTGDLMSRITEDISNVRMYIGPSIMYFANILFSFIMIISQMLMVNARLTGWVLLPLPILAYSIYIVSKKINVGNKRIQEQLSKITTLAQETFAGIRIIKSFGAEKDFEKQFQQEGKEFQMRNMKLAKVNSMFFPLMSLLVGISTVLVLYIGGLEVQKGNFTAGNVAEFVIYLNMLIWPVASLGWTTALVQKASASQKRINEFLNLPEYKKISGKIEKAEFFDQITLKEINFKYSDKDYNALTNINLTIKKGDFIGITGKTGSGKSTLIQLLARQITNQNGEIFIDNIDYDQVKYSHFRSLISYVPQDVFLFSETIESNILFGQSADELSLSRVLEITQLEKDIQKFNHGIKTLLGERGVSLSGGQKQRVSLARALIKNSEILILDDCLSAVDAETESMIINRLKEIFVGKTVIMSSHRVSPFKSADKIIVLDSGEITEIGRFDELEKNNGYFKWLIDNQIDTLD